MNRYDTEPSQQCSNMMDDQGNCHQNAGACSLFCSLPGSLKYCRSMPNLNIDSAKHVTQQNNLFTAANNFTPKSNICSPRFTFPAVAQLSPTRTTEKISTGWPVEAGRVNLSSSVPCQEDPYSQNWIRRRASWYANQLSNRDSSAKYTLSEPPPPNEALIIPKKASDEDELKKTTKLKPPQKKSPCNYCADAGKPSCGLYANKCPNRPCSECHRRHRYKRCRKRRLSLKRNNTARSIQERILNKKQRMIDNASAPLRIQIPDRATSQLSATQNIVSCYSPSSLSNGNLSPLPINSGNLSKYLPAMFQQQQRQHMRALFPNFQQVSQVQWNQAVNSNVSKLKPFDFIVPHLNIKNSNPAR